MIKWKNIRSAPKTGYVRLLGTTDVSRDDYHHVVGEWDEDLGLYITKSGWCIVAVAWRT